MALRAKSKSTHLAAEHRAFGCMKLVALKRSLLVFPFFSLRFLKCFIECRVSSHDGWKKDEKGPSFLMINAFLDIVRPLYLVTPGL